MMRTEVAWVIALGKKSAWSEGARRKTEANEQMEGGAG
jgi:hypothetical protein